MKFEWDEEKRAATIAKHGIDFVAAARLIEGDHILLEGADRGERRLLAIGLYRERLVAVVFTMRRHRVRIITARRARANEERAYRAVFQ